MELRIEKEFQEKIPPLTNEEFEQLRENILNAGEVYEPIAIWNGIIVDGHNRYKIIQEHPEIKWRTREMDFQDKWAAFDWMYKNQLGRRNLTEQQRTYILGKMYEARKHAVGSNQHTIDRGDQIGPGSNAGRVYDQIAKEQNVGKETVKRSEKYANGIDAIREEEPELADSILKGQIPVKKADVMEIAKETDEPALRKKIEMLRNGESIRKAEPKKEAEKETESEKEEVRPGIRTSEPVVPFKCLADDPRAWKAGTRENREFNRQLREGIANMSDPSKRPPYTLEMLFSELGGTIEMFIRSIEGFPRVHKDLYTKENREKIKKFYEEHLDNEIKRIKGEIRYV